MKPSRKVISTLFITLSCILATTFAGTYASYSRYERHQQKVVLDLDYSKYFDATSGDGKSIETAYVITTPDHLRNLSYLTNLGLLDETDFIKLGGKIDFASEQNGKAMLPIGNMHSPFRSTFDGQDNIISGLKVIGNDNADVGMFGTIGMAGTAKNFILENPVIESKTSYVGTWDELNYYNNLDKNPLRDQIGKDVRVILTEQGKVNNPNSSNILEGITSFSLSIENLPAGYTAFYEISDTNYLSQSGNTITVNTTQTVSKYLTVRIYTQGIVTLEDGSTRFAQYTIETFKFYYDGTDGHKYIIANPDNGKCYKAMINPSKYSYNAMNNKFEYHNNRQLHTVGIVVGNLYGVADRITVVNATIKVYGKPFISNSLLIGRKIDDDNKSPLAKTGFDMNLNNITKLNFSDIPKGYENIDSGIGNQMLTNIYGNQNDPNPKGLIDYNYRNTIRIFKNNSNGMRNDATESYDNSKDQGLALVDNLKTVKGDETVSTNSKALRFDKDAQTRVHWITEGIFGLSSRYDKARFNNGIYMYTSAENESDPIARLLSTTAGRFFLTFEFDYVYFDDSFNNLTKGQESQNELAIYAYKKKTNNKGRYEESASNAKYYWTGSSNKTADSFYLPDKVTPAGETIPAPTNDPTILKCSFADLVLEKGENGANRNPLRFTKEEIAGTTQDINSSTIYKVQHKSIKLDSVAPGWDPSNIFGIAMPLFFIGMDSSKSNHTPYSFNILSFEILISDVNGNYGGSLVKVDFSNSVAQLDGGLNNQGQPKNEWKSSKNRVSVSLLNEKGTVDNVNTAPALAPLTGAENFGSYAINAKYQGSKVVVTYKMLDKNNSAITTIVPKNTKGFSEATIKEGNVA